MPVNRRADSPTPQEASTIVSQRKPRRILRSVLSLRALASLENSRREVPGEPSNFAGYGSRHSSAVKPDKDRRSI
jgi:hypothetical protein